MSRQTAGVMRDQWNQDLFLGPILGVAIKHNAVVISRDPTIILWSITFVYK